MNKKNANFPKNNGRRLTGLLKESSQTPLLLSILIPLATGALSALFAGRMSSAYSALRRPPLSPPGSLFPIVWTILYILMGISSYLVFRSENPLRESALKTYGLQLLFNFFWSILFFRFSLYFPALLWLLAMTALILLMLYQFYRISRIAAFLQLPYLLWCLFALYLNLAVCFLN